MKDLYTTKMESVDEDGCLVFAITTLDQHHCKLEFFQPVGLGSWPRISEQVERALNQMCGD